jgi:ATP-dependent DNA helicase RecQ
VYASTRKTVERMAQFLDDNGIPASPYHAGLDDERRRRVQDYFMSERTRVIVATNSFGMGVDKSNVRLVVHYAMPGTLEAYYQEAGRAGRDGGQSRCVLLHAFPDRFTHEFFIKSALPDRTLIEQVHRRCQREADRAGVVSATADELAGGIGGKTSSKAVESALRVLADAGVLRWDPESAGLVKIRLLATPERIRDELGDDFQMERELLRACWRVAKDQLSRGAIIDLDGLPPGFGGFFGAFPMLEALEARQFVQVERVGGGLRLVDPTMSLDRVTIDWRAIDRRRQREFDKLEAMQRYAYATTCRRQALLKWFGDPAARSECGGCDNCLGERRSAPAVRSAWASDGPARTRTPRDPNVQREAKARSKERGGAVTEADADLFNALKACRAQLAVTQKVPHYVVFPDATLAAFATRRPLTPAAMSALPGVGPVKLERYAAKFLDVIRAHGR